VRVEVKVSGTGRIEHRCYICKSPITGDPIFLERQGLHAYHADCLSKENTDGR
jgi:(p)ppGpp synthase/HD superfamily hydrolase